MREKIASERGYKISEDGVFYNPKNIEIGFLNDNGYVITRIKIKKYINV